MHTLVQLIEQYGLVVVFANVLFGQLGAPLPAYPQRIQERGCWLSQWRRR